MLNFEENLSKISSLANRHKIIIMGEIHGVKENVTVAFEVIDKLRNEFVIVVGFEYPQSLIENPDISDPILLEDGRYSPFHKKMIKKLKQDSIEIFGFDLNETQLNKQNKMPWDWRDKIMAENINKKLKEINFDTKIFLITGDIHYQTKIQEIMYPDEKGEMKPIKYLPMGAQLNIDSLLAVHLRYLSGQFYNFKLRQIPKIDIDKSRSFREIDDVIELDIGEAHATKG